MPLEQEVFAIAQFFLCLAFYVTTFGVVHTSLRVKKKDQIPRTSLSITTTGLVDLHFHGAFGIDLMRTSESELNELSRLLWKRGLAAFCPTTLSAPVGSLASSVASLGTWIRKRWDYPSNQGAARPLGIHLEGPFIHPHACGAHPMRCVRKLSFNELDQLWELSQGTLKILTIAPEQAGPNELQNLRRLKNWCSKRQIYLSIGHSKASEDQAIQAIESGFDGVTHAWNAMAFHHRYPGILGASLGYEKVYLELILDLMHVSSSVVRWTLQLHPRDRVCFISDCVPAAETQSKSKKQWVSFGSLRTRFDNGACILPDGSLAGGGRLLPQIYRDWLTNELGRLSNSRQSFAELLQRTLCYVTSNPLRRIGLKPNSLKKQQIHWNFSPRYGIQLISID